MKIGTVITDEFNILVAPRTVIGGQIRLIVEMVGYDDVAVAVRNEDVKSDEFKIERIISTEQYDAIDSDAFRYNAEANVAKLGKTGSI